MQRDAFLRWRYDECPVLRGYLALRDGECLAMVTALARPYRVGGVTREVRESFDWYCLPRYRGSGLGVRVLRRLMEDPEPVLVIGGSADTRELLPKLGFQVPDALVPYTLPLGPGRLSEILAERAKIPPSLTRAGFALLRPLVAPRRRRRSDGARALAVSGLGPEIEDALPRRSLRRRAGVARADAALVEAWQAVCEYSRGINDPEKTAARRTPPLCQPPSF